MVAKRLALHAPAALLDKLAYDGTMEKGKPHGVFPAMSTKCRLLHAQMTRSRRASGLSRTCTFVPLGFSRSGSVGPDWMS